MRVLSEHPGESVPQATSSASESQSIYRFWSNQQVKSHQILESHRAAVVARGNAIGVVLAIQDTTDFDFTSHRQTQGLGYLNQTQQQGLKVHSCLAVSGDGDPLGVLHQYSWVREHRRGKREQRRKLPIEQKESYRWLKTAQAAEQGFAPQVQVIHLGDREADIFELFVQPRRHNSALLIRAEHNRKVRHELDYLVPTLNQAPVLGNVSLELERNPTRPARTARVQLRALQVTLEVPRNHPQPHQLAPVTVQALLVEETQSPTDGSPPIRWLLLTTLPIESFEQAWQVVQWYALRWLIERFHYTLKSGCRFEQLQLQTRQRLLNALATYAIVAWRLMSLTYQARLHPDASCERVLQPSEWRLLRRKFEPKNRSQKPPSLHQAMLWIARLGGFLARQGDGEPGLKTLWRGIGVLHHLLAGMQLAPKT